MAFDSEGTLGVVRARRSIQQLRDLGVVIPRPVGEALNRLDALADRAPQLPPPADLIEATLDGDPDKITAAAVEAATFEARRTAHAAAMQVAGRAVSDTLRASKKPVLEALTRLARQHVDKIRQADTYGDTTVEQLVVRGDHDGAATVAARTAHAQALNRLQSLADRTLGEWLPVEDPASVEA